MGPSASTTSNLESGELELKAATKTPSNLPPPLPSAVANWGLKFDRYANKRGRPTEGDSPPERRSARPRISKEDVTLDPVAARFRAELDLLGKTTKNEKERSHSTGDLAFLSNAIYLSDDIDLNECVRRSSSANLKWLEEID